MMRIVKPYGRSTVTGRSKSRQLDVRIKNSKKSYEIHELSEFAKSDVRILIGQWISIIDKVFNKPNLKNECKDPKKWDQRRKNASPNEGMNNDKRRKIQIEARNKLGEACWKIIGPKIPQKDFKKYRKIWIWKLNPFGDDFSKFKNDRRIEVDGKWIDDPNFELPIKGQWYESLMNIRDVSSLEAKDYHKIASHIRVHLEVGEVRKYNDPKQKDKQIRKFAVKNDNGEYELVHHGLIENRANSIARNSLPIYFETKLSSKSTKSLKQEIENAHWTEDDEKVFSSNDDLAETIYQAVLESEKKEDRFDYRDAIALIHEHYGATFKDGADVKSRKAISYESPGLLAIYDALRNYYKKFLKNTGKGRVDRKKGTANTKLSKVLPKNSHSLFNRLERRRTNAITNDLIRLGRVIHYEGAKADSDGFNLGSKSPIWNDAFLSTIPDSYYLTSDGQSEIKRTEAFVRVWRHAIGQAARTARAFADVPMEELDQNNLTADVLTQDVILEMSRREKSQENAVRHMDLLFGNRAHLFTGTDTNGKDYVRIDHLMHASLRLLASIRNKVFHFKGRRDFIRKISSGFDLANNQNINNLIPKELGENIEERRAVFTAIGKLLKLDQDDRKQRILKDAEGAQLHLFADENQLRLFFGLFDDLSEGEVLLPKFNTLLQRLENTGANTNLKRFDGSISMPASQVELKDPARRAKFVAMKMLYEQPFRVYLNDLSHERLTKYAEDVIAQTTENAIKLNPGEYSEFIEAKAADLPMPSDDDSVASYMDKLMAEQSTEMRVQKGYESDSETARSNSEWVEKFRRDIIGLAFADYLADNSKHLHWLLKLKEDQPATYNQPFPEIPSHNTNHLGEDWHAMVYFVLHFIPANDVSLLLHQFRKWGALESKTDLGEQKTEEPVTQLQQILTLYLDMQDDKHDGAGMELSGIGAFKNFYESEDVFDAVFKTQGSDDQSLNSTRRALRQVMRFGHFQALTKASEIQPITMAEVERLSEYERIPHGKKASDSKIACAQISRKKKHKVLSKQNRLEAADIERYLIDLNTIKNHATLANRVRLTDHIKLHQIMMRVVTRLLDYGGTWERDGYFIALALMKLKGQTPNDVFVNYNIGNPEGKTKTISAVDTFIKNGQLHMDQRGVEEEFWTLLQRFYRPNLSVYRNKIHHFAALADIDIDLTQLINETRELVSYDRKLKNAVSKSIIDLMQQEGLDVGWQMDANHNLCQAKLTSRKIQHLAGKKVITDDKKLRARLQRQLSEELHSRKFANMVLHVFSGS